MTVLWIGLGVVGGVVLGAFGVAMWFTDQWDKNNPFGW